MILQLGAARLDPLDLGQSGGSGYQGCMIFKISFLFSEIMQPRSPLTQGDRDRETVLKMIIVIKGEKEMLKNFLEMTEIKCHT